MVENIKKIVNVRDVIIVMSELNKISPLLLTLARAQISIRDCVLYGVGWWWLVVTIPTKET